MDGCENCHLLPTKYAEPDFDDEIEILILRATQILEAEDAGFSTDWNLHDPELAVLVVEHRKAEKELKLIFDIRHQHFIKAHFNRK